MSIHNGKLQQNNNRHAIYTKVADNLGPQIQEVSGGLECLELYKFAHTSSGLVPWWPSSVQYKSKALEPSVDCKNSTNTSLLASASRHPDPKLQLSGKTLLPLIRPKLACKALETTLNFVLGCCAKFGLKSHIVRENHSHKAWVDAELLSRLLSPHAATAACCPRPSSKEAWLFMLMLQLAARLISTTKKVILLTAACGCRYNHREDCFGALILALLALSKAHKQSVLGGVRAKLM